MWAAYNARVGKKFGVCRFKNKEQSDHDFYIQAAGDLDLGAVGW
jgi:hypothetical protein